MVLSRTVNEINGKFSRKLKKKFQPSAYFAPPLMGLTLELGVCARGQKAGMMGLPEGQKSFQTG